MSEEFTTVSTTNNTPQKKSKIKLIITAAVLLIIIGIVCVCVSHFTSDSYKYKQAVKEMQAGNYEAGFEVIYELYPDDVLLPFNGLYTDISIGDKRTLKFENGEYSKELPGDSSYNFNGTYEANSYTQVTLTDPESSSTEKFNVYKNYIYECEEEKFVFDEEIDISNGLFNGTLSEKETININLSSINTGWNYYFAYIFEDDGTYTEVTEQSEIGSDEPYATHRHSGTYAIEDNFIVLSPNDDENVTKSFLVIDNKAYRTVYERDYTSDISWALRP